jgi:hypothetical protein
VFGVHSFGFSFTLRESLQFAGNHLMTALFGFNIGVEIGKIAVLLVLIPALGLLFKYVIAEWLGIIILSALIAHVAWHWMIERGERLAKFPFPKIDAAFLASAMRGLMAMLIVALAVLLANSWLKPGFSHRKSRPQKMLLQNGPPALLGCHPNDSAITIRFRPPYPQERTNGGHRGMSALSLGLGRTGRSTA